MMSLCLAFTFMALDIDARVSDDSFVVAVFSVSAKPPTDLSIYKPSNWSSLSKCQIEASCINRTTCSDSVAERNSIFTVFPRKPISRGSSRW